MAINWEKIQNNAREKDAEVYQPKKTPGTQNASPAMPKEFTMNQLQQQRQRAQVDMDMDAVNRIDAQMKQLRAQTGQQTIGDRLGDIFSGATNTSAGQYLNAAGTMATGVDYNERQIKRLQEALAKGYTSDGKMLTDATRKNIEESIARMQRENAEVMNDPNRAENKLQQIADRMSQTGAQQIQEAKAGLGKGGQFAVDVGVGALQLAGDIGANMVVPGAGIAAMGVRSFGGAAQEARKEGATQDQQMLYGAGSAAASLLTEKIANVASPFKKAFGGGVLDKALGKIAAKPAGKLLMSALSEGGEEMLENVMQPVLQRLTYDPEAAYDSEWVAETLYSGAVGAVLGGFGGNADIIGDTLGKRETKPVDEEWRRTLATIAPERQIAFSQAKEIADRFGTKLNVGQIANGASGEYLNGQITIDPNANDPVRQVLVHELTHHMETSGLYKDFSDMVMDYINTDMSVDLNALREGIAKDYAEAGKELSADMVDRELVAKFAEDMLFRDERTIERLLLKDRNLFQKIYDWIRDAVRKMKGTEQEAFLIEAQNMYEKALRKAGAQTGAGVAQYRISNTLRSDLEKVKTNSFLSRGNEVYVGETSNFLTGTIGADALDVTMPASKAYSAIVTEEQAIADGRYQADTNYHGLGVDGLLDALEASENPVAAFADTGNGVSNRTGNVVLVTDIVGKDGNIVVVETLGTTGYQKGKRIKANKVITSYDRRAIANDILQAAADGRLLHMDKKRSQTILAGVSAANSQRAIQGVDFEKNIQDFWANVKWENAGSRMFAAPGNEEGKSALQIAFENAKNNAAQELSRGVTVSGSLADTTSAAFNDSINAKSQNVKDPYDIIPNLAEMAGMDKIGQNSLGRSFWELAKAQEKTEAATDIIPNLAKEAGLEVNATRANLTTKEREYLKRTESALTKRIGWALSVPSVVQREDLKPIVQQISDAYLQGGTVDQALVDGLFETAYQNGIEVDTQFYDQHKEIKDFLRSNAVSIRDEDKVNIADYGDFRRAAMGTLNISKNGTPVDILYERLKSMDPSLFPERITDPAEQLQHMYEVGRGIQKMERTLEEYYGEEAETFKQFAKHNFEDAINQTVSELRNVRRHAEETAAAKAIQMATPAQVAEAYSGIRNARKKAERAVSRELLTKADDAQVKRLLKGEIELSDLDPKKYNVKGIKNVYEAKLEYEGLSRVVKEYKKQHTQQLRDEADVDLATALMWKDKKAGLLYSRETMERNIRDIVPDRAVADKIIQKYFEPVHTAQAASTRAKNDYRARVRKLKLNRKVEEGNNVSEAYAVQFLGEAEDNIRMLQESTDKNPMRDGKTLQEWKAAVNDLWAQNPKLNKQKIANAVTEFRSIYDELFHKMNEVRVRNGYEPVAYRQGYFPHFQPGETGLLAAFGNALGINADVTSLPTSINGLTHTFRPGITWFGHAQERKGFETAYDAVQGFDKYIEGAADVIYQTDNIQRLRALASQIRYRTTDEGMRQEVDKIRQDPNLTEDQKNALIEKQYKEGQFTLGNFVVELEEYTNLLANKKSRADRNMEQAIGRRGYNLVKALESRVAANMVAINPSSWLTNFIPLTQGMASLDTGSLLKGMADTIKAYAVNDGMVDVSTFLTNRRGSDPLVRTWAQNASAKLSKPMEFIDSFTADTLVRARYAQNVKRGMSEAEALRDADSWAATVMADRSKGSTPTLFNRSNPLTKAFTQFQLEVNNQMSYVFKDVPDELKKKGVAALTAGLLKMFVGAWLYNEVYEYFVGRRPAMDPLNILNEFTGDLTGYEVADLLDAEGKIWKETEKEGLAQAGKNLAGNVAEQLPFMAGLNLLGINVDAGRIPVANAIPDIGNLWDAATNEEWAPEKRKQELGKELGKPLTYLVSPFGGGMAKKWAQTAEAIKKGGSYTVNSKGEEILQYPVYTDENLVANVLRAGLFGKSSLPTAQEWVQSGFDSFSAKETAAYQNAVDVGVSQREANDLLRSMGSVQKTETESAETLKRKMLQESGISEKGKAAVFYSLLANEKEQEIMDGAEDRDVPAMAKCFMEIKNANLLTGKKATKAKLEAIARSGMSADGKENVYLSMNKGKEDEVREVKSAGVSIETWLRFETMTAGMEGDAESTKKEKVLNVIDGMNITEAQKDALYLTMYSENTIDDAPWKNDPYDLVGNIMRGKIQKFKAPELKLPELKLPTLW